MKITRVGVDLAKSVFQVHGVDRAERCVWKRQLKRSNWLQVLTEKLEPGCEIGMEACRSFMLLSTGRTRPQAVIQSSAK